MDGMDGAILSVLKDNEPKVWTCGCDVKFLNVPHTCRNNGTGKLSTGLTLLRTFSLYPLEGLIFPCSLSGGHVGNA